MHHKLRHAAAATYFRIITPGGVIPSIHLKQSNLQAWTAEPDTSPPTRLRRQKWTPDSFISTAGILFRMSSSTAGTVMAGRATQRVSNCIARRLALHNRQWFQYKFFIWIPVRGWKKFTKDINYWSAKERRHKHARCFAPAIWPSRRNRRSLSLALRFFSNRRATAARDFVTKRLISRPRALNPTLTIRLSIGDRLRSTRPVTTSL